MEYNTCGNNDVHGALGKLCQHVVQMPTEGAHESEQVTLIIDNEKSNGQTVSRVESCMKSAHAQLWPTLQ
jgi:hypothetical protein